MSSDGNPRQRRRQDLQEAHLRLKEAKILSSDAVRFQQAAKAILPKEIYRSVLAHMHACTHAVMPPHAPEPEAAAPAESEPR